MSTSFSVPRDTIISTALRKLQVIELGTTPDANTLSNAAQSLNIMIKAWQSQGIKLWTVQEYPIPLVAGQNTYTIGNSTTPTTNALVGPTPQPVGGVSAVTMSNNGTSGAVSLNYSPTVTINNNWGGMATNGSIFVAGGGGSLMMTSTDGVTWTSRNTGLPSAYWSLITWNGSIFVAVSSTTGQSATSPDGITWTLAGTLPGVPSCLTYGNGLFVAGGLGFVCTSSNGAVWTKYTSLALFNAQSIVWNGTKFVMVGLYNNTSTTIALYSTNGTAWSSSTLPTSDVWSSVAWNGTVFAACSVNSHAAYSINGTSWTAGTLTTGISNLAVLNGTFIGVGTSTTTASSPDGNIWTTAVLPGTSSGNPYVIAANNTIAAIAGYSTTQGAISTFSFPSAGTYQLTFTGGTGTGAAGTYTISSTTGQITSTAITTAGTGYYGTAPTISFLYGGITGAAGTVTVSATNTASAITAYNYTADKPLKVIQAWARNISVSPNLDIPLEKLSRQEYNILGSKFTQGMVNSVWYDPNTTYGTAHLFLTPDTATATNYILYLVGQRPLGDVNLSTDIPDFPNEWMQALIWGLADELAIEYGLPINHRQEIAGKAEKYRKEMEDWDVEEASTKFIPDMRFGRTK